MSVKLGTLTLDLVARVSGFTQGMNQASTSAEREMRRVENSVVTVDGLIKKLAVTAGATFSVAQIVNYADSYTNIENKLKLVTKGQNELTIAMADTFKIAQGTASNWSAVNDVYSKYMSNAKTLSLTQAEAARLTDITSKAVAISGSTSEAAAGALFQYGQSLDGNILRAQEYNSLVDGAGGLLNAMAKGLNITRGELHGMMIDGKLTGDVITKALLKAGDSVDELYAKTATTMTASLNLVKNEVIKAVGEFDSTTGASIKFVETMSAVAKNMDTITMTMGIGAAFMAGTYIPTIYASAISLSEKAASQLASMRAEQLANEITAQRTARIAHLTAIELANAEAQLARMSGMARLAYLEATVIPLRKANTAALAADTVAQNANNHSKNLGITAASRLATVLMGPVGLGLAVAGVAASYLMLRDSTKDTTSTLDLQKGTVSELVAEYSKLDDLQKRTTMRELEKQVKDLSTAYTVSFSDLNAFIGWLEDSGSVSESTAKEVNRLYKEYRTGGISASEFATSINGLSGVQDKHKQKIDDLTTAQAKSKAEYEKVKTAQDALTKQTGAAIKANKDEAESYDAKRLAQEKLIALDKSYAQKNLDIDFSRINIKNHGLEMGKALAEFYDENKLSKTQKLSVEQWAIFQKNFSKQQELKNLENDITQAKKDQTKELEKQQKALQVNAKVQANAANFNFKSIEGKYGLPTGLLSGIHMQESRGNANAVGPQTKYGTAKGGFQFLDGTASRFKLFGKDVFDLGKSADAAGQYLQILYKKFGDWDKAISAYHAGEGNVAAGTNIGPVNRQYVKNIKGYVAGVNGYSGSSKDFDSSMDDQAKYAQKTLEEIDQLNTKYSNADVIRNKERLAEIAEAERLGQTQLIDQINLRYSNESYLAKLQLDQQVNGWKWVGEERISKEAEVNRAVTNASKEFSEAKKQFVINGIDALSKYEIDEYRKTQKLKIAEYQLAFSQPLTDLQAEVLDMQAKANMGGGYGAWALQNQYGKDLGSFGAEYDKNVNNINEDKTITDDAVRKQMLLDAEESFRLSKLKLNEKYTLLEQDLTRTQHESQMSQYSQMISIASDTWGQMTSVIKDAQGENSAAYKAMFLIQQTMAAAQAVIYANVASAAALAPPPIGLGPVAGVPLAAMIKTSGYINAGLIMAQGITGMAHNGIDNIPKEGTWLLDGGERVLNPQQNKDLTNYLSNKGSSGGNIEVNVQVTDSGVTSQSNQTDQKQLGQLIGNAVRTVIMQEKRQGGLLAR